MSQQRIRLNRPSPGWASPVAPSTTRLGSALALLTAVIAALAGLLPALALVSRDAWLSALAPGPAEVGTLIIAVTGPISLALTAWLLVAIMMAMAEGLLSRARSRSSMRLARTADWTRATAWFEPPRPIAGLTSRCARMVAPALLRHCVAAMLGVTLLSSPAVAATETTSDPAPPGAAPQTATSLFATWPPARAEVIAASQDRHAASIDDGSLRGWIPAPPGQRAIPAGVTPANRDLSAVSATGRRRRLDEDGRLVVRRGETLWSIAARSLGPGASEAQIAGEWPRWFMANRDVIGPDPDRLFPGQRLRPPPGRSRIGDRG
jgi:hypothetical protein